jgi:hypothetical protein
LHKSAALIISFLHVFTIFRQVEPEIVFEGFDPHHEQQPAHLPPVLHQTDLNTYLLVSLVFRAMLVDNELPTCRTAFDNPSAHNEEIVIQRVRSVIFKYIKEALYC